MNHAKATLNPWRAASLLFIAEGYYRDLKAPAVLMPRLSGSLREIWPLVVRSSSVCARAVFHR